MPNIRLSIVSFPEGELVRKVLFIMPGLGSGGAERVVFNLLTGLEKSLFKFQLLLLLKRGFLVDRLPPSVIVETYSHKRLLGSISSIWKALKSDADIVFSSGYHNPLVAFLALITGSSNKLILRETAVVGSAQGRWKNAKILRFLMPMLYRSCRCVIFQSEFGKQDFESYFNFNVHKSKVLINPSLKYEPKISGAGKSIFLVGTLNANKNQALSLRSIAKSGLKGITVEIFGDGPLRADLEKLVKESDYNFEVKFHGNVSDLENHWHRAALHIMASSHESLPNAVLEAAMAGVPSVCLNSPGGLKELFMKGNWGKLVERSEDLPQAISEIFEWKEDRRMSMAKDAEAIFHVKAFKDYEHFLASC